MIILVWIVYRPMIAAYLVCVRDERYFFVRALSKRQGNVCVQPEACIFELND